MSKWEIEQMQIPGSNMVKVYKNGALIKEFTGKTIKDARQRAKQYIDRKEDDSQ